MADEKPWLFKKETHSKVYKLYRAKYPPSLFALIRSKLFQASQALPANLQKGSNGLLCGSLDSLTLPVCRVRSERQWTLEEGLGRGLWPGEQHPSSV